MTLPREGATSGNEPEQLRAEQAAPPNPFYDDPETLLWHFVMNSRQRDMKVVVPPQTWLLYARTLRKLLHPQ